MCCVCNVYYILYGLVTGINTRIIMHRVGELGDLCALCCAWLDVVDFLKKINSWCSRQTSETFGESSTHMLTTDNLFVFELENGFLSHAPTITAKTMKTHMLLNIWTYARLENSFSSKNYYESRNTQHIVRPATSIVDFFIIQRDSIVQLRWPLTVNSKSNFSTQR